MSLKRISTPASPNAGALEYDTFFYIAITVTLFNLIGIFGPHVLLHDDPAWYCYVVEGKFPKAMMKYNPLYAYKEWLAWNIMVYSPQLARGLYVLFMMVPLSCCCYYLYRHKLGFSRAAAFTAAVLPNILPHQWQIPGGINMSYTLWGLLIAVFSLILGLQYLEKSTPKNWLNLFGSVMLYLLAILLMEQSVFLFPPFAFLFWGYPTFKAAAPADRGSRKGINKKQAQLISFFFIIAAAKLIQMIVVPSKPITKILPEEIFRRIGLYFKWSLPAPDIAPLYITLLCLSFLAAGFIVFLKHPRLSQKFNNNFLLLKKKFTVLYLYGFFLCWVFSTIFIFICMSKPYSPRYTHISSFGLNAILIFSIYIILEKVLPGKNKLHIFVFSTIIIFSGISRYLNLKEIYVPRNETHSFIVNELSEKRFPAGSQIVISGIKGINGWYKASGYLKRALQRKDLNGLIGNYRNINYNFYNHFDPKERRSGYLYNMTGLALKRPVFLFKMSKNKQKLEQLEYALHWQGKRKNVPWTILHTDKTSGEISPVISGFGLDEYMSIIEKLKMKGISQSDILWGGPPSAKELKRLQGKEM